MQKCNYTLDHYNIIHFIIYRSMVSNLLKLIDNKKSQKQQRLIALLFCMFVTS